VTLPHRHTWSSRSISYRTCKTSSTLHPHELTPVRPSFCPMRECIQHLDAAECRSTQFAIKISMKLVYTVHFLIKCNSNNGHLTRRISCPLALISCVTNWSLDGETMLTRVVQKCDTDVLFLNLKILSWWSKKVKTSWSESASELYRPSDRRLSAKWLPTWSAWRSPTAVFSVF
jgi:hypothetical protein